jgi:hypothetical protein
VRIHDVVAQLEFDVLAPHGDLDVLVEVDVRVEFDAGIGVYVSIGIGVYVSIDVGIGIELNLEPGSGVQFVLQRATVPGMMSSLACTPDMPGGRDVSRLQIAVHEVDLL